MAIHPASNGRSRASHTSIGSLLPNPFLLVLLWQHPGGQPPFSLQWVPGGSPPFGSSQRPLFQLRQSLCPWGGWLPNSTSPWKGYSQHILSLFFCLVRWGEGLASSTTNLVVGTTWVSTLAVGRSFGVSISALARSTVVSSPGGVSAGLGRVSLTSASAGEVAGSPFWWTSGWQIDGVICPLGFHGAWLHVSNISGGGWGNGVPLWDSCIPALDFMGSTPEIPEDILLAEGDVPLHMLL